MSELALIETILRLLLEQEFKELILVIYSSVTDVYQMPVVSWGEEKAEINKTCLPQWTLSSRGKIHDYDMPILIAYTFMY